MNLCLLQNEKSRVFANSYHGVVSDYANEHAGAHRVIQRRVSDPEASLKHRTIGSLDLFQMSYGSRVQITSPEREALYHLHIILKGHCMWRSCGEEHSFAPGELLLLNPGAPFDLTYSDCYEKFIVKLPARFIDKVCSENQWSYPSAETDQTIFQVKEHYAKIIVSKLLSLPGSNVSREPLGGACRSFERLEEFIEKNLKQSISLERLADLAHMSAYSLYALFEKHVGTTPKRFIRQRKLEAIYARLSDPLVAVSSVTEVALDYGFLHLGRFADYYKSTFGELPSDTLRRRG